MMIDKLAVYGTLKKGFPLHNTFRLADGETAEFLGSAWLDGFEMWSIGYPMIKRGDGRIFVEVYRFHKKDVLERIDILEKGFGYRLEEIEISFGEGKERVRAGIYIYQGETAELNKIDSGNYNPTTETRNSGDTE